MYNPLDEQFMFQLAADRREALQAPRRAAPAAGSNPTWWRRRPAVRRVAGHRLAQLAR